MTQAEKINKKLTISWADETETQLGVPAEESPKTDVKASCEMEKAGEVLTMEHKYLIY